MLFDTIKIRHCASVYSPGEDSRLMAEAVEEHAQGKVLDMGTGAGVLGIVAAKIGCDVTFVDNNVKSIQCARQNAEQNDVSGKFIVSDLFGEVKGRFNTIIFNPPYLPSKDMPKSPELRALEGGRGGREVIERFLEEYKRHVSAKHSVLMAESSLNDYANDIPRLGAKVVKKAHYFFEDLAVLMFK